MEFAECFTLYGDRLVFWYDTLDGSAHVEIDGR
jgi:hypothetical protein